VKATFLARDSCYVARNLTPPEPLGKLRVLARNADGR
jgi:hypothetical protein